MLPKRKGGRTKEEEENPRVFFCLCTGQCLEQAIALHPLCGSKAMNNSDNSVTEVTSHACGPFIQQQGQ